MESPVSYAKHHKYVMGLLVVAVVFSTAIATRIFGNKRASVETDQTTKVELVNAKDYLEDKGSITANGIVESLGQADLRSQAAGPVTAVPVKIGQRVAKGQVLVSLQQSDAVAGLAQARAILKTQQIRLDEMRKGTRNEQVQLAAASLNAAKQALVDLKTTQDAVVASAYSDFLNTGIAIVPNSYNTSHARITLGGSYLLGKEGVYTIKFDQGGEKPPFKVLGLEETTGWVTRGSAVALGKGGLFITVSTDGDIIPGDYWTITIPNTQSPFYATAKNGYETVLKARDAAINGATNAVATAQKSYDLTVAGATNDQIKAQEAAVEQAAAVVAATEAQLEKTLIRSPIEGVVAGINVKYGELVSPGTLVAKVVSKGGLQVKAYLSEYDLPFVKEGASSTINETVKGRLSQLSPSVDSATKNIEAIILVANDKNSGLVVGQSATVKIDVKQGNGQIFLLPLQSVQIGSDGASVYTVNASSTLEKVQVKLGKVQGEFVQVTEGIRPDMKIVSTVYELKPGEQVVVE